MTEEKLILREDKVNTLVSKFLEVIDNTTTVGKLFKKVVTPPPKAEDNEEPPTVPEVYLALAETIAIISKKY